MALVEEGVGAGDDPEALLNEWLGELNVLTAGLQNVSGDSCNGCQLRPLEIVAPRIDSYRFSMANLEETQDADLDAILGELCALDSEYDEEISRASSDYSTTKACHGTGKDITNKTCSDGSSSIPRTDSPDNDSAFSDTVSLLSSESSASSSTSAQCKALKINLLQNQKDPSFQQKADKIKLALERMREASIKKLFIKAFSVDGSSKSLLVDEKMTCGYVTRLLADKNHVTMEPKWAIVEHLPDLYMERVYEDHELLVDNLMLWTRESKNKILFAERQEKISLFQTPEKFLLSEDEQVSTIEHDEHSRQVIIEEFFGQSTVSSNIAPSVSGHRVPPIEGPLYLKSDAKKGWKKYHFVLRPSGLYYFPKEKVKALKELVCLATFDTNEVYTGVNWKKKYKSPTDFCFAIKHPRLQQPKSVKFIKFLCAEDQPTLDKWVAAMRIAKHGRQILENYRILVEELTQDDIDHLAHARSCSMSSIQCKGGAGGGGGARVGCSPPQSTAGSSCASDTNCGRHSRTSSSSSSGCLSDGGTASESAFDCEFPMGTIKRKPSMKPNIPLTWMTRQLKEMVEKAEGQGEGESESERDGGTLTRRPRHAHDATLKRRHHASIDSNGIYSGVGVGGGGNCGSASPSSSPGPAPLQPPPAYGHYEVIVRQERSPHLADDAFGYASIYELAADLPLPPAPAPALTPAPALCTEDAIFASTLSLESLPPPPPPPDSDLHSDLNISQLSLPPPPPEIVSQQLKPRNPSIDSISKLSDQSSQRSAYGACLLEMQKTLSSTPQRDFIASDDKVTERASSMKKQVNFADVVDGSMKKNKKISFAATCSGSPRKPPPPKRNESTKLSSPKKLADSNSNPPKEFIKDLQKVMRKKWQVAQKCKLEPKTSPHEVLGFREYPLSDNYKEASVSMWVQEHYGREEPYYENSAGVAGACAARAGAASSAPRAPKRPPPAPPRRDTTRLSTAQHAC